MKRGLFAAVLCLSVVGGLYAAEEAVKEAPKDAPKPAEGKPKIKFDQTTFDFGKTSQVDHVSGTFTFKNIGDADLKMGKPSTSCGCTVAGVKPEILKPGDTGELSFSLNLGRNRATLTKQITVESNDPENPKVQLTVKADYTPLYDISPVSFYFNLRKGESTNVTARVTRTDGKPFKVVKIKPTQTWIEAKTEPEPNSNDQSMKIVASLKPEGSPRYFTEMVNVFTDETEQSSFAVTFSGRLLGDLVVTPESLYWPIMDPEKSLTARRIIIKSSLADKLDIKNVTSSLKDLSVEAVPKEDGKTVELVAKLASAPAYTTNAMIRFESNIPSQPNVQIPVWINVVPPAKAPATPAAK